MSPSTQLKTGNLNAIIMAVQYELKRRGLYLGEIDGDARDKTWSAIHQAVGAPAAGVVVVAGDPPGNADVATSPPGRETWPTTQLPAHIDDRSEQNIATLLPDAQRAARALLTAVNNTLRKSNACNASIKVISGSRTYDEQNALYAKGRTEPGAIVTNCRGGYSNHNFGIAFDIGVFGPDGHYYAEHSAYDIAGEIGKSLGLAWGGDWNSFQDKPHFELRPDWAAKMSEADMMVELRRRKTRGEAIA